AAERWSVDGDKLRLEGPGAEPLVFERQEDEERPEVPGLIGPTWVLRTLPGAQLPEDRQVTIEFRKDDAGGESICNIFGGEYELDGDRLTFGRMSTTARACADPADQAADGLFFNRLGTTIRWEVADRQLL